MVFELVKAGECSTTAAIPEARQFLSHCLANLFFTKRKIISYLTDVPFHRRRKSQPNPDPSSAAHPTP